MARKVSQSTASKPQSCPESLSRLCTPARGRVSAVLCVGPSRRPPRAGGARSSKDHRRGPPRVWARGLRVMLDVSPSPPACVHRSQQPSPRISLPKTAVQDVRHASANPHTSARAPSIRGEGGRRREWATSPFPHCLALPEWAVALPSSWRFWPRVALHLTRPCLPARQGLSGATGGASDTHTHR